MIISCIRSNSIITEGSSGFHALQTHPATKTRKPNARVSHADRLYYHLMVALYDCLIERVNSQNYRKAWCRLNM